MDNIITFRENVEASKKYKEEYVNGIEKIIEEREKVLHIKRNEYFANIFQDQEKYRKDFKDMLGWPLTEKQEHSIPEARTERLSKDGLCSIYRISIKVLDNFYMTGLLFQKDDQKRPLVIAQHGGKGTPELVGNLYGDTDNYNHMIERLLSYNVNVFAPQLLLWESSYQVKNNRDALDARLKRVGSSITALEIYGITRLLDYFETQDYVGSFGMVGLSYGGFYTLFTAAVDTRIKAAISCSFFNSRKKYAWIDWTWFRAAQMFSDAEIACLVYPRKLCIEVGINDELFDIEDAREEIKRLKEMGKEVQNEWVEFVEFEGVHEFCLDNAPLKRFVDSISLA